MPLKQVCVMFYCCECCTPLQLGRRLLCYEIHFEQDFHEFRRLKKKENVWTLVEESEAQRQMIKLWFKKLPPPKIQYLPSGVRSFFLSLHMMHMPFVCLNKCADAAEGDKRPV